MLETNVRIVRPGLQLYINVRRVTVEGQNLDPDLLEHVCSVLRRRYGLAAAREPGSKQCLLVASDHPVPSVVLQEEHWEIRAKDASEPSQRLYLHDLSSESLVTTLIERALLAEVAQRSHLWTLDSPRIWYETQPFCCEDGIAAYRRYEVAAVFIEEVGIGALSS